MTLRDKLIHRIDDEINNNVKLSLYVDEETMTIKVECRILDKSNTILTNNLIEFLHRKFYENYSISKINISDINLTKEFMLSLYKNKNDISKIMKHHLLREVIND